MKVKTINTSEVNENSVKVVSIDDKEIAIFNVEGEYFAIDDMCSHAEASLAEGEVFDCKIKMCWMLPSKPNSTMKLNVIS